MGTKNYVQELEYSDAKGLDTTSPENLLAPGSMGTTNHPMGVHETLVVQLQNPTTIPDELKRRSKRRAYCLRALRDRRVEADYKLDLNVDVHMASQAVSDSDAILNIS